MNPPDAAVEACLTVSNIADALQLSRDTVRRIFIDEPGVLRVGEPTRKVGRGYRRRYFTLRIPVSVFERVRDRMQKR